MNTSVTTARSVGRTDSIDPSTESSKGALRNLTELAGRVLLAAIFLISGLGKISAYAATAAYMTAVGVPGALLPAVIATEVLGAIAIVVGTKTPK